MKKGDRVIVKVPNKPTRTGTIIGEGRKKLWWNVRLDGHKIAQGFAKRYCQRILAESNQPASDNT